MMLLLLTDHPGVKQLQIAVVAVKAQPGFFLAQFIMHSEKFESRL